MLLKTKEFKKVCQNISSIVDSKDISSLTDLLELVVKENNLYLNVTNKEYFVSVKFPIETKEEFKATVNATLFLKLISQLTTEEVDLVLNSNSITINANGKYKISLVYSDDKMMELPEIQIFNPTVEMDIDTEILESIEKYNSKELLKGTISGGLQGMVQKLHYIDNEGAITFTTGACVNSFSLPKPIKILLNNKLVKLFSLFSEDSSVHFTLGYDSLSSEITQTKIRIEGSNAYLTAILNCDNTLLSAVPAKRIRERALNVYPYFIDIDKNSLLQAINRMMLFIDNKGTKQVALFEFDKGSLTISDTNKENFESVECSNFSGEEPYIAYLDLNDLKITLSTCIEQFVNISFGDHMAFVIHRLNISNVLPECEINA